MKHYRLNLDKLMCDLRDALKNGVKDVSAWLDEYEQGIKDNHNLIVEKFQQLFPKLVVELESGFDDNSIFYVQIYGRESMFDLFEKKTEAGEEWTSEDFNNYYKNAAYDLADEIGKDFNIYCIIPSFTSTKDTQTHYPEIYERLIKKLNLNIS